MQWHTRSRKWRCELHNDVIRKDFYDCCWNVSGVANVVVTCEIKLLQNYFSLRRRPYEIILFQRMVETCLGLFQNYFRGLLQLVNIFQHVQCGWNNVISVSDVAISELKHWNNCEIISVFYFACNHDYFDNRNGFHRRASNTTMQLSAISVLCVIVFMWQLVCW